jgi:hypothetical protein
MKYCNKCRKTKPLSEFHKRSSIKSGYQPYCKLCKKEDAKKRWEDPKVRKKQIDHKKAYKKENRQMLYNYMLDKKCIKCGESDIACLQFDHKDEFKKSFCISMGMGKSWNTILKEINKCQILCANCHHKRTAKQYNWYSDLIKD